NSIDAFVARLSADLTSLDQATYLGGSKREIPIALALTASEVYVTGLTDSTKFPGTVGGVQSTSGGSTDAYVARLSRDLTALHQATYLGGANTDVALDLAIAPTTGDVYLSGFTSSAVFPGTAGGAQSAPGGAQDAFVARLSADLTSTPTSTTTTRPTTTSTSSSTTTPRTTTSTARPSTTSPYSSTTTTRPTTTTTSSTSTTSTSSSTTSSTSTTHSTSTSSSTSTTTPTSSTTTTTLCVLDVDANGVVDVS